MIKNIFKGFIIGIGKIIPGVSGSMLAISMGVYERALLIVSKMRNSSRADFLFIISLVMGVFIGISVFSKGVKWILSVCYLPIMLLFVGLIISGIPDVVKGMHSSGQFSIVKVKYIIIFVLSFLFSYFITQLGAGTFDIVGDDDIVDGGLGFGALFRNGFLFLVVGFIEAFSSIVPGISGTAIFMSLGCYDMLLSFYENIFNPTYFMFGIFFFAGVVIGIVVLARVITFLFGRCKCGTYWAIFGFMAASIVVMILMAFGGDSSALYAYGSVKMENFIDFDNCYWLSICRLVLCMFMVFIGCFLGCKINYLLAND